MLQNKGFTLIESVIGIALMLIIFIGILGVYQLGFKVVWQSRARITAVALANQKLEWARNLSYDNIGTIGGIPSGIIPQTEIISRNDIEYTIKTSISYLDDSFDGMAPNDSLPNDYKRVKVKVSWDEGFSGKVFFMSDIAPKGLETSVGGGNLLITVFDAVGAAVPQADIHLVNSAVNPLIDVYYKTNNDGQYLAAGAPASIENYRVTITKNGYSADRTYGVEEAANPDKPHLSVIEGKLTSTSFSIDRLSDFIVNTVSPFGAGSFSDSFANETKISEKNGVVVGGGNVGLEQTTGGVYFIGGDVDGDLCGFPGVNGDCGQSFAMGGQSKDIALVELFLKKATAEVSDLYLEIRKDSTIGAVLATSAIVASSDVPTTMSWTPFSFQPPVSLQANKQYFLRLRSAPDSTDPFGGAKGPIHWSYIHAAASPPAYNGGDAWRYIGRDNNPSYAGEQLGPTDQYDFSFKIYTESVYKDSGFLISIAAIPQNLARWKDFSWDDNEPQSTQLKYQVLYFTESNWVLVPNADLSGNSVGFAVAPVDLSGLDISIYPQLKLKALFSSSDLYATPALYDWQVSWLTNDSTPIPNVQFGLRGSKIIGTDINEIPIYKYTENHISGSDGKKTISGLEWDSYIFSVDELITGLNISATNPAPQPINLAPNVSQPVSLFLSADNSLLLKIKDMETSDPVFSASARLYSAGLDYDATQFTDIDGETIFMPLENGSYNYQIQVEGYQNASGNVSVSGDKVKIIYLTPMGI